jgi:pimeloyl-ACP methyl ester carboxylesterase
MLDSSASMEDDVRAETRASEHYIDCIEGAARLEARFLASRGNARPPLVALHGISRNAEAVWNAFLPGAKANDRALLVPLFDQLNWPSFQRIGKVRPDLALLSLVRQCGLTERKFDLFGYSGGAQLAHRFAMLYPHCVATLHLAAPGWYCLPDGATQWPHGLGQNTDRIDHRFDAASLSRVQLRAYLSLPLRLWVGAEDLVRDGSLRQSAAIDALQGQTRVDRAFRYAESFDRAAQALGITPDIEITVLSGCGHDFTQCVEVGGLVDLVTQTASRKPVTHSTEPNNRRG